MNDTLLSYVNEDQGKSGTKILFSICMCYPTKFKLKFPTDF
jgi:hypothetical protein